MATGNDTAAGDTAKSLFVEAQARKFRNTPPTVSVQKVENGFLVSVQGFDVDGEWSNKSYIAANEMGVFDTIHVAFSSKA